MVDKSHAIIAEITPRLLKLHPTWPAKVKILIANKIKVKVTGWATYNNEHPEQIGKTRGTLWEIHPILYILVLYHNEWIDIERYNPQAKEED